MKNKCKFCNKKIDAWKIRCKDCNKAWLAGVKVGEESGKYTLNELIIKIKEILK